MTTEKSSSLGRFVDEIEKTAIAICLGLMTAITFANVVARYVFNSNILWALEGTVYLFAWLVLMGMSYGVKKQFHIGVDVITNLMPPQIKRIMALVAIGFCLLFSVLLLKGSWDYWYPFATSRAWLETEDIPFPAFLSFLETAMNEGEAYEKIPRWIPYAALPLGLALLTFRFVQVGWKVWKGEIEGIIASHEVEEALEEASLSKQAKEEH